MMIIPRRAYAGAFVLSIVVTAATNVEASWWRKCSGGGSRSVGLSSPSSSPSAAAGQGGSQVMYYPMMVPAQQQQPAQGLTSIREIAEIARLLLGIANGGGGEGGGGATSCDTTDIQASLKRIEAGQLELRAAIINNARIGRALGEAIVDSRIESQATFTELRNLTASMKGAVPRGTSAQADEIATIKSRLDNLESAVERIGGVEAKIESMDRKLEGLMLLVKELLKKHEESTGVDGATPSPSGTAGGGDSDAG